MRENQLHHVAHTQHGNINRMPFVVVVLPLYYFKSFFN